MEGDTGGVLGGGADSELAAGEMKKTGKMTGRSVAMERDGELNDGTLKQRKANGRQECREDGK